MNKFYLSLLFVAFSTSLAFSQGEEINMQSGSVSLCDGAFFDSGGTSGVYSSNENFILTICPETEGDVVYVDFLTVNLSCPDPQNGVCDALEVFDGDNISANSMGNVTGPITFTASPLNISGCLTFQFTSNNSVELAGWAASVTCETPCVRPVALATTDPGGEFPIKVCVGEEIEFDGSTSYAAPGFNITDWEWDFRDGTIDNTSGPLVTHSYDEPGEYVVQLYLIDDNGCASTNRTDIQIWVGTPPNVNISNSLGSTEICPDQELCLSIDVASLGVQWDAIPDVELGTGITVPDIVGQCFDSDLEYNSFEPGQTLNSIDDLLSIYVNMEHSFMGDLLIQITCPDGTTVNLHEQGGGGTNLGWADQADNEVPGIGWDYWWSPTATLGTWQEESNLNVEPGSGFGNTLSTDTYSTVGNLEDLVGCPLNGVWSLSMCDLWGADDGTVFGWSLELNPDIYPELTTFTPVYGSDADSTYWAGDYIQYTSTEQDSICISSPIPGAYDYDFYMINDFGCYFDSIVTITVIDPIDINAGPDAAVQCEAPYTLSPFVNATPYADCDYELTLVDNWGNGWDGGQVELILNGTSTIYTADVDEEYTLFNFTVPHDSEVEIIYTAGGTSGTQSPGQNEIILTNGNGVVVFQDGQNGLPPDEGTTFAGPLYCFPPEPVLNYSWSPAALLSNPNIQNPTVSGVVEATTFTLEVWSSSHPDCIYTDEITLTVLGALDAGEDIAECAMSYGLNGTDIPNGEWSAPPGSGVTFSSPTTGTTTVTGTTAGTYTLSWTDLDSLSCPITSEIDVTFFDGISITPTLTQPICHGDCNGEISVSAVGGSIAAGTTYTYTFTDGATMGATPNEIIDLCTGYYDVLIQDNYGCSGDLDFFLDEPPAPVIDSVGSVRESCFDFCDGTLTIYSPVAEAYSFDGGATYGTDNENSTLCGGTYNVVIQDAGGCQAAQEAFIASPTPPHAMFSADPLRATLFEPNISFTNFSTGNYFNDWIFGIAQEAGISDEINPTFSFPSLPGIYTVELIVTDSIGCQDSARVDIEIMDEFMVFVPTAFSPNDDGINDLFHLEITDLDLTGYVFQVFDRFGNVVYETNEYPTTWNGQGADNENYYVADGTYVWRVKASSASTTKKIERMGTVTVIR